MKYTKYLIKGNFVNVNAISTDKFYLKLPVAIVAILVAVMGIAIISGMLPMTFFVDEYRNAKCILKKRMRKQ